MLEKPPDIEDANVLARLQSEYSLQAVSLTFLPLGADADTAVYRVVADDAAPYFLKLRRGVFVEASVAVPKFLSDSGMKQIITPLPTQTGELWATLAPYTLILYPFVEGRNGFEVPLSAQQRVEFGAALKRFHTAVFPAALTRGTPRETFAPRWRDLAHTFVEDPARRSRHDALAAALSDFLQARRSVILALVQRAGRLSQRLQTQTPDFILCHGDIHGWNLLLDLHGSLYIVNWDTLIFAPKERDLMFVGCGLGGRGQSLEEEMRLFYRGYGQTQVNASALAYYRYERIIEDIALNCEQIFLSNDGEQDRQQALVYLQSNFAPSGTIELAYRLAAVGK